LLTKRPFECFKGGIFKTPLPTQQEKLCIFRAMSAALQQQQHYFEIKIEIRDFGVPSWQIRNRPEYMLGLRKNATDHIVLSSIHHCHQN
jgi:hypothetical protein